MQPSRAFLLRCWPTQQFAPNQSAAWRFCLEEVGPERRELGFASLEALVTYLAAELDSWMCTTHQLEEDGAPRSDLEMDEALPD